MRFKRLTIIAVLIFVFVLVVLALSLKRPASAIGVERWGVTFSHQFGQYLEIDWRKAYIAVLDELKPPIIRLPFYWDDIEKNKGEFNFEIYDFLVDEAEKRGVELTLVVGMRVPRWPECHIPLWAKDLPLAEQKEEVKGVIIAIVERYKQRKSVTTWQVENEPFLPFFGDCPQPDGGQLDEEIKLVRFLDPERPILVTDSGELSTWLPAAKRGDVFGTTMYRIVWSNVFSPYLGFIDYHLPPKFFWLKANIVHLFFGNNKRIINVELQAEPWNAEFYEGVSKNLDGNSPSMNLPQFYDNIAYAREVGFPDVYLWGVEWWYVMKEEFDDPRFWEAAKDVIATSSR